MSDLIDKENNIIIDDTFLTLDEIASIREAIYSFPYHLNPSTGTPSDGSNGISDDNQYTDYPMMVSGHNTFVPEHPVAQVSLFLLDKFIKKHDIKINGIYRSKSNITFTTKDSRPSNPHIDSNAKHFVFLYYVNDCDGDTILYKNIFDGSNKNADELEILHQVSPKAGRLVWFEGNRYHTWIAPNKSPYRIIINMNVDVDA